MIGAALFVCAGAVLALKINVIVQLTILVIEIIQAIATAPETFGASLLRSQCSRSSPAWPSTWRSAKRWRSSLVEGGKAAGRIIKKLAEAAFGDLAKDAARQAEKDAVRRAEKDAAKKIEQDAAKGAAKRRGMPDWLKERFEKGRKFNEENWHRYQANEMPLSNGKALDSCTHGRAVVSRKNTQQIADIQPGTWRSYLREHENKYAPGTTILDGPKARGEYSPMTSGGATWCTPSSDMVTGSSSPRWRRTTMAGPLSVNWEPVPAFGQYESIARRDRG